MSNNCQIAIADDDFGHLTLLSLLVQRAGHKIVAQARSGTELVSACSTVRADVAIVDLRLPGTDAINVAKQLWDQFGIPVIIVSSHVDNDIVAQSTGTHIAGVLLKPIRDVELLSAIAAAHEYSSEIKELREKVLLAHEALEERKLIERAKGILMQKQRSDEASAFKCLQMLARSHRLKLADVAKKLILADVAFQPEKSQPVVTDELDPGLHGPLLSQQL